jgi:hypothetical protein
MRFLFKIRASVTFINAGTVVKKMQQFKKSIIQSSALEADPKVYGQGTDLIPRQRTRATLKDQGQSTDEATLSCSCLNLNLSA